ncbi:MAG: hypothetical protein J6D53_09925 [Blautia sp.]|nr:hypothetical protein [Blautia sp.]
MIRFLATEDIPVEKAIIDAGITPYPYPKWICRLISVKDWIMIMPETRSLRMMKLACPPVNTKIEYWYGEEEKRAREKEHDIEFVSRTYPQTAFREFKGLAHAELVMMFPERFAREVKRFLEK